MSTNTPRDFGFRSVALYSTPRRYSELLKIHPWRNGWNFSPENHVIRYTSTEKNSNSDLFVRSCLNKAKDAKESGGDGRFPVRTRRGVLVTPFIAVGAYVLRSVAARADEQLLEAPATVPAQVILKVEEKEEVIVSRIYDATVIGEPLAVGKDKRRVWEKLMNARIVYLGEAEQVPVRDDKDLELEIVKNLRKRCLENDRPISLALEAFPCNLQEQLNQFMDKRFCFDHTEMSCLFYIDESLW